jgi:hypothetical protein
MGELAPWHDPRHRVGRPGLFAGGGETFDYVFFFDCSFATFKLNQILVMNLHSSCSEKQKSHTYNKLRGFCT